MEGDVVGGKGIRRYQFRRQHEKAMMRRIVRLWWYEGECSREVLPVKRERGMAQRGGWVERDGGGATSRRPWGILIATGGDYASSVDPISS